MAALDVLVVAHRVPGLFQCRGHLACMPRMHAIIAGRRGDQDRRVRPIGRDILIGRVFGDELPVPGIVGITVLGHPGCTGQQQMKTLHVQQWDTADQGAETIRVSGQHDAHQQSAVAAALSAEAIHRGDPACDQIGGHRREVLVDQMPALAHGLGMPTRPVLTAAANIGQHIGAAAGQPQPTEHTVVSGRARHLESAVPTQQRRPGRAGATDHEIGNGGAIGRGREVLTDLQSGGVEEPGRRLDRADRSVGRAVQQLRWCQESA